MYDHCLKMVEEEGFVVGFNSSVSLVEALVGRGVDSTHCGGWNRTVFLGDGLVSLDA